MKSEPQPGNCSKSLSQGEPGPRCSVPFLPNMQVLGVGFSFQKTRVRCILFLGGPVLGVHLRPPYAALVHGINLAKEGCYQGVWQAPYWGPSK